MAASSALGISESPSSGKWRFKIRPLANYVFCLIIFTAVAVLFSLVASGFLLWLADAGAIAVLFYLNFYVLEKRGIRIRCPHCTKYIATNVPWICGFCEKRNDNIDAFPFIHRCEHCSAEPRSYKCHHRNCGKLIFLTDDHLEENFARCVSTPIPDETEAETNLQAREKRKMEHELIMAELSAKLNLVKEKSEFMKKKSPRAKKEESFESFHGGVMAAREIAREKKTAIADKYKDDPEMLQWSTEAVDEWLKSET